MDEPTATLTQQEVDRLFAIIADLKRTESLLLSTNKLDAFNLMQNVYGGFNSEASERIWQSAPTASLC